MVLGLCRQFGCLPDPGGLMQQDAGLLRLLRIEALGTPEGDDE